MTNTDEPQPDATANPADDAVEQTAETGGEPTDVSGEESEVPMDNMEMPPASFTTLVSMFMSQAMVALGMLANPMTGKSDPQLPVAKHFIDIATEFVRILVVPRFVIVAINQPR